MFITLPIVEPERGSFENGAADPRRLTCGPHTAISPGCDTAELSKKGAPRSIKMKAQLDIMVSL
jgi:hypothetical protein